MRSELLKESVKDNSLKISSRSIVFSDIPSENDSFFFLIYYSDF